MAAVPSHSKITTCSSMRASPAPTWLTLRTHTGEGNGGKICERGSPERYAVWQDGGGRRQRIGFFCPSPGRPFGVRAAASNFGGVECQRVIAEPHRPI